MADAKTSFWTPARIGAFEWLDGDGIWLPRRAVEGTFTVIGSFDRRKANH